MDTSSLVLLGLGVFAGAATQRVTGLGFALVSSPLLVLVAGPLQGVLLANVLSLMVNLAVLLSTWRAVELRRTMLLAVPALAAVAPGAWVARNLPPAVLMVTIGALVVIALLTVVLSRRARVFRGRRGAVAAGALSGFMNVTAGVGGPAVTLYAISTQWAHAGFVGSMQFYFAIVNAGSIAAKGLPDLSPAEAITAVLTLSLGVVTGNRVGRRVTPERARSAVITLALLGACATMVKGAVAW